MIEHTKWDTARLAMVQHIEKGLLKRDLGGRVRVRLLESLGDRVAAEIEYLLLQHELDKVETRYPADWWQACKERWFPQWALKRWPVEYHEVTLTAQEVKYNMVYPEESTVHLFKEEA